MTFSRNTIFFKIFQVLFFVIISFSIIFSIYSVTNQKSQILNSLTLEAHNMSKMITYASSDAIVLDDGAFIIEFNSEFIKENKLLKSMILSKPNDTYYIIKKNGWSYEDKIDLIYLNKQEKLPKSEIIYSNIDKENIYHYVYPINFSGTHWGWLHLNLSLEAYHEKITNMYIEFSVFFIMLLIVSLTVSYFIARNFSNPIIKLNDVANEISRGNLKLRNEYKSDDEIGELSNTFNKMIARIEASQYQLKNSHENLEKRVDERTLALFNANKELQDKRTALEELNINLDNKVKDEVLKRTKQENLLIQQSRLAAMGEMLGNIAHQWRQPLSVVTTAASGMKLEKEFGVSTNESEIEKLDIIIKTSNFLSNTIEDFSNFFRPNKSKINFDIKDMLGQSLELVSASLKFYHIKINKDFLDINNVYGFPNEYAQAVLNILTNAKDVLVENKIENPIIKISTYEKDNYGYLEIEDNAGGIDESVLEKIFDPYFTTKHQSQGTGIGLYMSKMIIVQNMNGILEVKNSSEGAVFVIAVPLV